MPQAERNRTYNTSEAEVRRQQQRKKPLRVEKGGRNAKLNPVRWVRQHLLQVAAVAIMVFGSVGLLQSEARITELTAQIQSARATLVAQQSEKNYYTGVLNSRTSISSVEEAAGRLGLMKLNDSQVVYIRLHDSSVVMRRESAVREWTEYIHAGALTLIGGKG